MLLCLPELPAYLRARERRRRVWATAMPPKSPTRPRPSNAAPKPNWLPAPLVGAAGSLALGMSDALLLPAPLHASPSVAACTVAVERAGALALAFLALPGLADFAEPDEAAD